MPETLVECLYVVRDWKKGTISTEIAPTPPQGGLRISLLEHLDLDSSELRFDYVMSNN